MNWYKLYKIAIKDRYENCCYTTIGHDPEDKPTLWKIDRNGKIFTEEVASGDINHSCSETMIRIDIALYCGRFIIDKDKTPVVSASRGYYGSLLEKLFEKYDKSYVEIVLKETFGNDVRIIWV